MCERPTNHKSQIMDSLVLNYSKVQLKMLANMLPFRKTPVTLLDTKLFCKTLYIKVVNSHLMDLLVNGEE